MSKSNVNPDHYKIAGRERQGEDILQERHKQKHTLLRARQRFETRQAPPQARLSRRLPTPEPAPAAPAEPTPPRAARTPKETARRKPAAAPRRQAKAAAGRSRKTAGRRPATRKQPAARKQSAARKQPGARKPPAKGGRKK